MERTQVRRRASGHHDRDWRRLAGLRWLALLCFGPLGASAEDAANHGYPTDVVPLKAGVLLCEAPEQVAEMFANWRLSFDVRRPEQLAIGCGRTAGDSLAAIEYVGPFENEHWSADLLAFYVLKAAIPGMLVLDRVYYGYGSAVMKTGVLNRLPVPSNH